jgi:hypothetical protein
MLRFLASGFLTRRLARPLARVIPNPILRTVAIAATGYAVERMLAKKTVTPRAVKSARARKPRFA